MSEVHPPDDEHLLKSIEAANDSADLRLDWLRHIMTMCSGVLAVLVALQDKFTPKSLLALVLLCLCWLLLTLTVIASSFAMLGYSDAKRSLSQILVKNVHVSPRHRNRLHRGNPKKLYGLLNRSVPVLLAMSMAFLCSFAIVHSISNFSLPVQPNLGNALK